MHQGLIVEQGTHEELMKKESYYHGLVMSQEIGQESPFSDPSSAKRNTYSSIGAETLASSIDDITTLYKSDVHVTQYNAHTGDFQVLVDDGDSMRKDKALTVIKWVLSLGWDRKWAFAGGLISVLGQFWYYIVVDIPLTFT